MSGGSYDYLHATDLTNARGHLERMRDRLHALGHHDAALRTSQVLAAFDRVTAIQAELYEVWRAVEWIDSGDCVPGDEIADLEAWRKTGKVPTPEQVDIARRLSDLEREARALRLKCSDAYNSESSSIVADAEKRA
jgi:hypothetical protein